MFRTEVLEVLKKKCSFSKVQYTINSFLKQSTCHKNVPLSSHLIQNSDTAFADDEAAASVLSEDKL
jgi:hypothetical protein